MAKSGKGATMRIHTQISISTTSSPVVPVPHRDLLRDISNVPVPHQDLLRDISNDLARDFPFFLEMKLKNFFNSFLSELYQKFEDLPGSLLEKQND
ncbi:hypothetical protein VP01_131g1 [Puccinia sorghi]|uniref:Uncharacterized protein n=1 Tax=Puccinia sorghi TaxID=27349 RepID=A0A0L6VPG4_9BASI|nr:hypothetical protein VP01_131g1 [Puccinia sorghi]